MNHKRLIAMLLTSVLALSLFGCSAEEAAPKVGICFRQESDSRLTRYAQILEDTLTQAGYQVSTADAMNDQSKQKTQLDGFIGEGYDLLVVEPVMASAAAELIEQARAADIPLVFINREPVQKDLELWEKTCYVGCDAQMAALLQGQIILQTPDMGDINGDGTVSYIVISGPANDLDAQARTLHCTEKLTQAGVDVELLVSDNGAWSQTSGEQICARFLAQYGKDIEVVFCNNDAMALGALTAIQDGGRVVGQDIYLVGCDAERQALEMVQSGCLTGTVATDLQTHADQICQVAAALLSGQEVKDQYYIDYETVAQENVETFLAE